MFCICCCWFLAWSPLKKRFLISQALSWLKRGKIIILKNTTHSVSCSRLQVWKVLRTSQISGNSSDALCFLCLKAFKRRTAAAEENEKYEHMWVFDEVNFSEYGGQSPQDITDVTVSVRSFSSVWSSRVQRSPKKHVSCWAESVWMWRQSVIKN